MKVAIVGYGRVGKVLLKALPAAGWDVCQIITRQNVTDLAVPVANSLADLNGNADLVLLCLRGRDLIQTALETPQLNTNNPGFLFHTAGALSAEVLAPARERGWHVLSWHPMQTFTGDEEGSLLRGVTFGIDGDDKAIAIGERLARDLGGFPFIVPPDRRAEYHLGAVIACNLLVELVAAASEMFSKAGMSEEHALQAVAPLMKATIDNLARKGLASSITGPLQRGDLETIQRHLETLKDCPGIDRLYRLLSLSLLKRLEETSERLILKDVLESND